MSQSRRLQIRAPLRPGYEEILTPQALAFLEDLVTTFRGRRDELLERRRQLQARLDAGESLGFLPETREVREGAWKAAALPADLLNRRVEITGPTDRKMVINALNSGANVFMADFEDSNSPTWDNLVQGQLNVRDAVRGTITFKAPETGKEYRLAERTAVLFVRPRGWHLDEKHVELDGKPIPGGLFDFALHFFHNARTLVAKGSGPYFYLPKLEHHLEARLWNDVFVRAQEALGLPRGTIKATVLIETIPAAFQMDEIIHELRDHSAGLNCGRWDYIFSFIKRHRARPDFVTPDRIQVTMNQPFMRAYTQLAVKTCHRRGVPAMGGMSAYIPTKDPETNRVAFEQVKADKTREVNDGHDGTWVAHPGLVPVAREIFDSQLTGPNQLARLREDFSATAEDLLKVPAGPRTERGLRHNTSVGVQYLEAWLRGNGCVPLYNLMEDAATAEISRTQVWQWIRHGARLDDGRAVTADLFRKVLDEELANIRREQGAERFEAGRFPEAARLFERLSTAEQLEEFLTLPAYELLVARPPAGHA